MRWPGRLDALLQLLGVAVLALVALRSPTVWPEWSVLPDAALAAWALVSTARAGRAPGLASPLVALGGAVLLASHLAAVDADASWGALATWARLVLAFSGAAALCRRADVVPRFALAWAGMGALASLHAAWQVFIGHPSALRSGLVPRALQGQFADDRANSVFLLPAHLSAFLAEAAVLSLGLVLSARTSPRVRAAAVACAALCLGGQVLAGSLGGAALTAAGLATVAILCLSPRRRVVALAGVAILAAALAGVSAWRRGHEISRENPGWMRSRNWAAALRLVREAPALGHGGGSFAMEYPRVKDAAANDARHAHQAFLEAAADHGAVLLPLFSALAVGLLAPAARALAGRRPVDGLTAACVGSAVVVLGHGLVDFGWSEAAWGASAAAVLGIAAAETGLVTVAAAGASARWSGVAVVTACALLVSSSLVTTLASGRERAALAEGARGRHREALGLFLAAQRVNPEGATAFAGAAQAALAGGSSDPAVAVQQAERAVAISPRRAALHAILAEALVAHGRPLEAFTAAARAAQLAPGDPSHARLRDAILAEVEASQ